MSTPLFSILHPSARPDKWAAVYRDWISKAANLSQVEYLLGIDRRWGFDPSMGNLECWNGFKVKPIENTGRRCYVDAVNNLAKRATGQILIVIADDQFACEGWDRELFNVLSFHPGILGPRIDSGTVIRVSTGTPSDAHRIMPMPILLRARYEKLGYVFYPKYESMFADNDFCEMAERDGVVIDARHLVFPHKHYLFDASVPNDEAYAAQNSRESWTLGVKLLTVRRENGFTDLDAAHRRACGFLAPPFSVEEGYKIEDDPLPTPKPTSAKGIIAVVFPGEMFSSDWLFGFLKLYTHLLNRFREVYLCPGYTTNVFHTRISLTKMLLDMDGEKPEYVLWIDDDNIAEPEHFERLLADLNEMPTVDVMAAWCWIHYTQAQVMVPSCGLVQDGGNAVAFDGRNWAKMTEPTFVGWTGFPFVLMRYEVLEKAGGPNAWLPIMDERYAIGMSGEDVAWCIRATEKGVVIAADPRVRVEHMKTVAVQPVMPPELTPAFYENMAKDASHTIESFLPGGHNAPTKVPRIAAMLRVKNEARWIKRVIESILPLCNAGVFVLDDDSSDETVPLAEAAGAIMLDRFDIPGHDLDEARDKNGLMEYVIKAATPDWILCIDGDEELLSYDIELIREACASDQFDCYTLHVLYLWNSITQWRTDGVYANMRRHSLFRPRDGMTFQSLYSKSKNPVHTGLHVSNAPVWNIDTTRTGNLGARLIHYGYLYEEDRLRKYKWYQSVDPNNEHEDFYRHMMIGDLPELPATARTKYAGPLNLTPMNFYVQPISEIQGWMTPAELQWLYTQAKSHPMIAEIGSWRGRSTHAMLSAGATVYAIDTWKGSASEPEQITAALNIDVLADFSRAVVDFNRRIQVKAIPIRLSSIEAAATFADQTFDMIFIDGDHSYKSVAEDIKAWLPKLKRGGLLCGHDSDAPGVTRALADQFPDAVRAAGSIWSWQLNDNVTVMVSHKPVKLNLGCSDNHKDDFTNVDICEPADVITDLRGVWPWEDSSVYEIVAHDIFEHLPDAIHTMNEAFRVLAPDGKLDIIVPTTEGRGAWQDPTHKSFWNRNSFFYFEHGNPHLHRFEKAYGMRCAFAIVHENTETLSDGVVKLHIVLRAVKGEAAMQNAAD